MLVLSSMHDVAFFKENSDYVCFSESYSIIQMHPDLDIKYLFDYSEPEIDLDDLVGAVVSNWYRDSDGADIFRAKEVSIGSSLNRNLLHQFSHSIRYYFALKKHECNYNTIYMPSNVSKSFKNTANLYLPKVSFYASTGEINHMVSSPDREDVAMLPIYSTLSFFLRLLQIPFFRATKNKILVFNDWTYRKLDNQDCLNINSFNPIKSFCVRNGSRIKKKAENIFPEHLNKNIIKSNINREISKFDIDGLIKKNLIEIFSNTILNDYVTYRSSLVKIYSSYIELFENYKPSMILVSSSSATYAQIIFDIAMSKGVKTSYIVDGITSFLDTTFMPKNEDNKNFKIDYYFSMSKITQDTIVNKLGNFTKVIQIKAPILKPTKETFINKCDIKFVTIVFPYFFAHSPYGFFDKRYKYVVDVSKTLISLGYKDIRVKMKQGSDHYRENENQLMRSILAKNGLSTVDLVFGVFSDYLQSSKFFVGPMGTSFFEATYKKVPFYVYNPQSFGISQGVINRCYLFNRIEIVNSLSILKENISGKVLTFYDDKEVFDGANIGDINFQKLSKS